MSVSRLMCFTGPASNALFVNTTTGNVGVGQSNPAYALDVVGTINASSNISIAGQSLQGLGVPNQVVFTSGSSTWTVPSGVTSIQVEMVGGGGSGSSGYSGEPYAGGGGAGGGYIRAMCSVSSGQSFTYTIGTGGTSVTGNTNGVDGNSTSFVAGTGTSVLNLVSPGGEKGYYTGTNAGARQGRGGYASTSYTASGTALTSTLFVSGGDGFGGNGSAAITSDGTNGGNGGGSYFGGGGAGGMESNSNNQGINAKVYGSGGGGGRANAASGTGAAGVVIITYFSASGLPATYTATAPLSMSGTTLSIATATSSAPGVVQVGTNLTISSGILSTNLGMDFLGKTSITSLATNTYSSTINLASSGYTKYIVEWQVGMPSDVSGTCFLDILIDGLSGTTGTAAWTSAQTHLYQTTGYYQSCQSASVSPFNQSPAAGAYPSELGNYSIEADGRIVITSSQLSTYGTASNTNLFTRSQSCGIRNGIGQATHNFDHVHACSVAAIAQMKATAIRFKHTGNTTNWRVYVWGINL